MATTDPVYSRRERYEEASALPVFAFAVLFVVGLIEVVSGDTSTGTLLITISWVAFAIDLAIRWLLSGDRRRFPRQHWFEVLSIVIPVFRIGMVVYVFLRLARRRGRLSQKVQIYAAYLTILIVVFGALLVLAVERDYPGSDITTYGDALWWAIVTVTTVGYGDFVPVSPEGRAIAVLMLINGVVLISVVTAVIAARFVSDEEQGEGQQRVTLDQLGARLARIESALASLSAAGGADPDLRPDADPGSATGRPDVAESGGAGSGGAGSGGAGSGAAEPGSAGSGDDAGSGGLPASS